MKDRDGTDVPAVSMFVPPGHFYSPIPDPADVVRHLERHQALVSIDSLPGIAIDRAAMVALWSELVPSMRDAPFPTHATPGYRYTYDNPAYGIGDGNLLHAMIRWSRPRHYIEIGSGWSSACAMDTFDGFLDDPCDAMFIEPYPALLERLLGPCPRPPTIVAAKVQSVPLEAFDVLGAGDILFIDSTHVLRTGGDVWHELFQILPRIRPGVLVHIHDMFWPFEYPRSWSLGEQRAWNEVYAVRAFLTDNPNWEILFFNDWFTRFERPLVTETCPRILLNTGGALWLRRR